MNCCLQNRVLLMALLSVVASAADVARAEPGFDPQARAKVVAPFVDPQTVAVAHVDLTRVSVPAVVEELGRWVPEAKADLAKAGLAATAWMTGAQALGAKEIYVVISLADVELGREPGVFLLVQLAPGTSGSGLESLLPWPIERRGGVLVCGNRQTLDRLKKLAPEERPELVEAFRAAGDTAAQGLLLPPKYMARVVEQMLPTLPAELGGGPSSVVTRGLHWAAVGVNPPPQMSLGLVVQSADAEAAGKLRAWWIDFVRAVGSMDELKRGVPGLADLGVQLAPEVRGDRLVLELTAADPRVEVFRKTATSLVDKALANAHRAMSMNNLKQLGLAMHNYYDVHKHFPPAAICDRQGKPLLSWRVALLPYLDQKALYDEFHRDEPWDSPHNRKLIDRMPAVYRATGSHRKEKGYTSLLAPVGAETVFPPGGHGTEIPEITDGTSNTVMLVELDAQHAVPWTKPDDWPFDPENPSRGLTGPDPQGLSMLFCDGSARFIIPSKEGDRLRAIFTRAGKEPVSP